MASEGLWSHKSQNNLVATYCFLTTQTFLNPIKCLESQSPSISLLPKPFELIIQAPGLSAATMLSGYGLAHGIMVGFILLAEGVRLRVDLGDSVDGQNPA